MCKLYTMVNTASNQGYINWAQNDSGFTISNIKNFAKKVLPKFFKTGKILSFNRSLNYYGFFKKKSVGRGEVHYYHPYFVRD